MKPSKPTNSEKSTSPVPPQKLESRAELRQLQRLMAGLLFRPLTSDWGMQERWTDGTPMDELAARFIKPNDRLTSFERLEIYNRQYWFRVLDCLHDDYPGLRMLLGQRKFMKLATAYLERHPSTSHTMRDLGDKLCVFLQAEPAWAAPHQEAALDMARFEWAQIVAFDGPSKPAITPDDILDVPASELRLGLQPHLSLLELNHAVDEFLLATKKRESAALRGETSNAVEAPAPARRKPVRITLPPHEKIYLAVHRHENQLYYKRLVPGAFQLLHALGRGDTVEDACNRIVTVTEEAEAKAAATIQQWFGEWSSLGWFCRSPFTPS